MLSATSTQSQVYAGEDTRIWSDQAKSNLWNIEWIAVGFASEATPSPTYPCVDTYDYCASVALVQGCNNRDYETRIHFWNDCPLSCGTWYNATIHPSYLPTTSHRCKSHYICQSYRILSPYPRVVFVKWCQSLVKMLSHCSLSCGFCSQDPSWSPTNSPTTNPNEPTTMPISPTTNPSAYSFGNNDSGRTWIVVIYIFWNQYWLLYFCKTESWEYTDTIGDDRNVSCRPKG